MPERDRVAGHVLPGLAVRYRPAQRFELFGRIDNLTDEDYETLIGFPGAGRSLRIGLRSVWR